MLLKPYYIKKLVPLYDGRPYMRLIARNKIAQSHSEMNIYFENKECKNKSQ